MDKYALVQQINRAVISVPSNISEGTSRFSAKELAYITSDTYNRIKQVIYHGLHGLHGF